MPHKSSAVKWLLTMIVLPTGPKLPRGSIGWGDLPGKAQLCHPDPSILATAELPELHLGC